MPKPPDIDPDNPPTRTVDWVGASLVRPDEQLRPIEGTPMEFEIRQASWDPALFLITDRSGEVPLPPVPVGGEWCAYKVVRESGRPRIGFKEADAKADILRQGFHLVSIRLLIEALESREAATA